MIETLFKLSDFLLQRNASIKFRLLDAKKYYFECRKAHKYFPVALFFVHEKMFSPFQSNISLIKLSKRTKPKHEVFGNQWRVNNANNAADPINVGGLLP